jgi:hypothetical protein
MAILENAINGMTFVKIVYASQAQTVNRLKNNQEKNKKKQDIWRQVLEHHRSLFSHH